MIPIVYFNNLGLVKFMDNCPPDNVNRRAINFVLFFVKDKKNNPKSYKIIRNS